MIIRCGYNIGHYLHQPTPMILMLNIRPELRGQLRTPEVMTNDRGVDIHHYTDSFGNSASRLMAPQGWITISADFEIEVTEAPDEDFLDMEQHPIEELPDDVLVYLLGSRYVETSKLSDMAWAQFGHVPPGGRRLQAILDYTHQRIKFGYPHAERERTAHGGHEDQVGVCRDFAHLAVALCRCMNIPARYCTGYLGDIRVAPIDATMDFSAWFQAYLGGGWRTADARHNTPRIGRVLQAWGRDATDVAIVTNFGPADLTKFEVIAEEV